MNEAQYACRLVNYKIVEGAHLFLAALSPRTTIQSWLHWRFIKKYGFLILALFLLIYVALQLFRHSKLTSEDFGSDLTFGRPKKFHPCSQIRKESGDGLNCDGIFGEPQNDSELEYAKQWKPSIAAKFKNESRLAEASTDCRFFRSHFHFPLTPLTSAEASFPLSYAMIVNDDLLHVFWMLESIYWPQNSYCYAVDGASSEAFQTVMDNLDHHKWNYAIMLGGNSDFPLRTNAEIVKVLALFNGANDVELNPGQPERYRVPMFMSEDRMMQLAPRYREMFSMYNRRLGKNMTFVADMWKEKPLPPANLNIYKVRVAATKHIFVFGDFSSYLYCATVFFFSGNAANVLSRPFVDWLFSSPIPLDLARWLNSTGSAEEQLWSTLVHNLHIEPPGGFPGNCLPFYQNKRGVKPFKDWITRYHVWNAETERIRERRPCSSNEWERAACVFGVADLNRLITRPELFAHKFRTRYQPAALQCLRERQCKRTYHQHSDNFDHHNEKKSTKAPKSTVEINANANDNLKWIYYRNLPAVRYQHHINQKNFIC